MLHFIAPYHIDNQIPHIRLKRQGGERRGVRCASGVLTSEEAGQERLVHGVDGKHHGRAAELDSDLFSSNRFPIGALCRPPADIPTRDYDQAA